MIICPNCNKRPGTEEWVGDGGVLAAIHGMSVLWCKICVLEAQLKHAKEMAENIPKLEKELESAKTGEMGG